MADNLYFCSMLERKRHTKMKPLFRRLLGGVAIAAALYSCASVGRIEGGPYDETPPRFISGTPTPGALHHNKNKLLLITLQYIHYLSYIYITKNF